MDLIDFSTDYTVASFIGSATLALLGGSILSLLETSPLPLLTVVLAIIVIIPVIIAQQRHNHALDPFEPIVFKSVFMVMTLILLADLYLSPREWQYDMISYNHDTGMIILFSSYILLFGAVIVGYYTAGQLSYDWASDLFPEIGTYRGRPLRIIGAVYMFIGAGAWTIFVYIALNGDLLLMFQTSTPRSEIFSGNQYLVTLTRLLYLGYFVYVAGLIGEFKTIRIRDFVPLPVITILIALMGGRGQVIAVILIAVVFFYYAIRFSWFARESLPMRIVTGIPSTIRLVALPIAGLGVAVTMVLAQSLRLGQSLAEAMENTDYISILTFGVPNNQPDNFLATTELIPDVSNYYYGTLYTRVPTNIIPRSVWDGKPPLTLGGELRRVLIPEGSGGRPPGEIGFYYANFGWPGILILGVFSGAVIRGIYELLLANRGSPMMVILFALALTTIVNSGLINGALFSLWISVILLIPPLIIHLVTAKGHKRSLFIFDN
jgi:oligosaccharide repeat unit polymerase